MNNRCFPLAIVLLSLSCGSTSDGDLDRVAPSFGKADGDGAATIHGDLEFGDETADTFTDDGQFFAYGFGALPNSSVTIEVTQWGSSRSLDTTLFLYGRRDGEAWQEIAYDDASGWGQLSRLENQKLPDFSDYLVVVGTEEGRGRGNFRLQLTCDDGVCALHDLDLKSAVPYGWRTVMRDARDAETFANLERFLEKEYAVETVYPPREEVFNAMKLTTFNNVRVVLLGQDPYHGAGQAHGLAFSVQDGVRVPPSLRNIFKELESDVGITPPDHGNLTAWGEQGVLLLNTALTVREASPASHAKRGWEEFTDAVITELDSREEPIVFILWGAHARRKKEMIDLEKHVVLEAAHPSPLSANSGFFGSRPFSQTNEALESFGFEPIDWSL